MGFYEAMEKTVNGNNNVSVTENGAIGYRSTGKSLLDLNFSVSSLRNMDPERITSQFSQAWEEDRELALRWLFFLRDVREGLGERRSFRIILHWLGENYPTIVSKLLTIETDDGYVIPFYGRWDDIFELMNMFPTYIINVVKQQIDLDLLNATNNRPVSLLAKWMPSNNTSSRETVSLANRLATGMRLTPRSYRKILSRLRKYIDVVEVKMSGGEWDKINYESVPSKANLLYNQAFYKHDPERRTEFLAKLSTGEAKINASTSYPYEIYHRMRSAGSSNEIATLEAMWKSILEGVTIEQNVIVVCDGSGSMKQAISTSTRATAYDVANSLALYFSETLRGEFHGKFITFSENPQLVDVGCYETLSEKMQETYRHREVANTNIEAVFDLVLQTAVENNLSAGDMPDSILIISDMEFDRCSEDNYGNRLMRDTGRSKTLFERIAKRFAEKGYKLPRLIFWNVCSRTMTIPVKENELGVALVSGFSINNINMILSGEMDPYLCLVHELKKERYDHVIDVVAEELNM